MGGPYYITDGDLDMSFRKYRGIRLSEAKQGELHFLLRNYKDKPPSVQRKIVDLCNDVGGEYATALFEMLTRSGSVTVEQVSQRYFVSASVLYEKRREFYERWYQKRR